MFDRTHLNKRSINVFLVIVACFITYLLGKLGCDRVIFVRVNMLVKVASYAFIHYPITLSWMWQYTQGHGHNQCTAQWLVVLFNI